MISSHMFRLATRARMSKKRRQHFTGLSQNAAAVCQEPSACISAWSPERCHASSKTLQLRGAALRGGHDLLVALVRRPYLLLISIKVPLFVFDPSYAAATYTVFWSSRTIHGGLVKCAWDIRHGRDKILRVDPRSSQHILLCSENTAEFAAHLPELRQ